MTLEDWDLTRLAPAANIGSISRSTQVRHDQTCVFHVVAGNSRDGRSWPFRGLKPVVGASAVSHRFVVAAGAAAREMAQQHHQPDDDHDRQQKIDGWRVQVDDCEGGTHQNQKAGYTEGCVLAGLSRRSARRWSANSAARFLARAAAASDSRTARATRLTSACSPFGHSSAATLSAAAGRLPTPYIGPKRVPHAVQ